MWDLRSLTKDGTRVPYIARWVLNHWTTREVPPITLDSLPLLYFLSQELSLPVTTYLFNSCIPNWLWAPWGQDPISLILCCDCTGLIPSRCSVNVLGITALALSHTVKMQPWEFQPKCVHTCMCIFFFFARVFGLGGFPGGLYGKESAYSAGALGSVPGLGRSPGEQNGNPLQYSCLENPMDREAWWAIVHGVTKSQIWLNNQHKSIFFLIFYLFILAVLVLRFCTGFSLVVTSSGYSSCSVGASHYGGSSCCGAQALGRVGSVVAVPSSRVQV